MSYKIVGSGQAASAEVYEEPVVSGGSCTIGVGTTVAAFPSLTGSFICYLPSSDLIHPGHVLTIKDTGGNFTTHSCLVKIQLNHGFIDGGTQFSMDFQDQAVTLVYGGKVASVEHWFTVSMLPSSEGYLPLSAPGTSHAGYEQHLIPRGATIVGVRSLSNALTTQLLLASPLQDGHRLIIKDEAASGGFGTHTCQLIGATGSVTIEGFVDPTMTTLGLNTDGASMEIYWANGAWHALNSWVRPL